MQTFLDATNLTCHYGRKTGIDGVSVQIQKGEVLALLGTNGAGKSTTLRILVGMQKPDCGSVRLDGIEILRNPKRLQHLIGYLPDKPAVFNRMRVEEFLYCCARLRGIQRQAARTQVSVMLELCALGNVSNRLIANLSMGYRQRVGLAQAMIHKPEVLLLDEPTTGLDPSQVIHFRSIIANMREHAAVLLSTHQLSEVEQMADRVQILSHGRCVYSSTLNELRNTQPIHMRFGSAFNAQALEKLSQVNSARNVSACDVTVETDHPDQVLPILLRAAADQQWPLLEIFRQHSVIESLFIEKTNSQ